MLEEDVKEELVGLLKRRPMCKICNAFDQETLNEITLDILLQRRTFKGVVEYYTPFLPEGVPKLNEVNVNSHKKHCNPKLLAQEYLEKQGTGITPGEIVNKLYAEIYNNEINRNETLNELYRERIKNMHTLQKVLDEDKDNRSDTLIEIENAQEELRIEKDIEKASDDVLDPLRKRLEALRTRDNHLQKKIQDLIRQIDGMQKELQEVLIKEKNSDKGLGEGTVYITQNYISIFQVHMQTFLEQLVPSLLAEFKEDPRRGKRLIGMVTGAMDKHIGGALDETRLLEQNNAKKK